MNRTAKDFQIVLTADGSPSLRIADSAGYVEKMHHSAGALGESLFIYGSALKQTLDLGLPLRVISVGLGLGYNEIIVAALAVQRGLSPKTAALFSFETEPLLTSSLRSWVLSEPSEFAELYQDIADRLAKEIKIEPTAIREWMKAAQRTENWQIRGAFPDDTDGVTRISCVLYDAFSNKMNPELWRKDLISDSLKKFCAPNCVFATYAATGELNRALRTNGFRRIWQRGFCGKRESTFAVRRAP